jgi:hypothetical protein
VARARTLTRRGCTAESPRSSQETCWLDPVKPGRAANDSRVALSIETPERNPMGPNEYLVIYGTVRLQIPE